MKIKTLLLSLFLLTLLSCNKKAPTNHLQNSSFEQQSSSGKATSWSASVHAGEPAYNFNIDKEKFYKGNSSFKIEQYRPQGFGLVAQEVKLSYEDYKKIVFSAKVSTKDVLEGNGFQLVINFKTDDEYIIKQVRSESISGSTDWTSITMTEDIPKGTTNLTAGLMLRTEGTVWLDETSLSTE